LPNPGKWDRSHLAGHWGRFQAALKKSPTGGKNTIKKGNWAEELGKISGATETDNPYVVEKEGKNRKDSSSPLGLAGKAGGQSGGP